MKAEERKAIEEHLSAINKVLTDSIESKPTTTVTVWWIDDDKLHIGKTIERMNGFVKTKYTINGIPDIPRIIEETFPQAFAIKVECTEEFQSIIEYHNVFHIWKKEIGYVAKLGWAYMDKYLARHIGITDSDIESAITAWLEKEKAQPEPFRVGQIVVLGISLILRIKARATSNTGWILEVKNGDSYGFVVGTQLRPATPAETASFYTCELAGDKVRAYETEEGFVVLVFSSGYAQRFLWGWVKEARALLEGNHIPVMPYSESHGNNESPKGE